MPGQRRERRHETLRAPASGIAPTELIVGLAAGVSDAEGTQLLAAAGAHNERKLRRVAAKVATVDPARLDAVLRRLRSDPRVRFAEPNYKLHALATPNDSDFGELWGLVNSGQAVKGVTGTADADIDADQAWNVTTGSSSVVVGILDTGVDFSHPDLGGSQTSSQVMWKNPGETGGGRESNGVDDDGNGYVDDWRGWDWANDDNNPQDDMNHGTHVAGTLGALGNNGQGIAGVNWNVKIMALKLLDSHGDGDLADAVEALRYATAMGARITNSSWGGGGFSQAMFDQLKAADASGALFVAAAGNSGANNDVAPVYPASYDVPNVISVAGTDQDDGLASFSNRGRTSVDVAAPGTQVYSTVLGGGYDWGTGTSMSAPHVTGTAALAAAAFPGATGAGLKALLLRTVDPKASLVGVTTTEGRLNAGRALTCVGSPKAWLESPRPGFSVALNDTVAVTVLATNCANPVGVNVTANAGGVPIVLAARGDGLYTGTYTPTAGGPVTLTATASVGALTDSQSAPGTVEGGYRVVEEPFSWVDATVGGTRLTLADDAQAAVALPFNFRYYGQPFSSVTVSSNGFLVFGPSPATAWINTPLPNTAAPQRRRRRLLGRPQPSPRRQHLAPHPRHRPQPQTDHQLDRHPPRRHPRPNQLPNHPRRRQQRNPPRLPRHPARKPQPRPRRLRHHRTRIARRHPRQPIPPQPTPPRRLSKQPPHSATQTSRSGRRTRRRRRSPAA